MAAPVVFFPGVMGTRLYFSNSDWYWDPDRNVLMAPWIWYDDEAVRLVLRHNQPAHVLLTPAYEMSNGRRRRGWSTVSWDYHGTMLEALEDACPKRVFAVGYDWRQRIHPILAAYAAGKCRKILKLTQETELILVGYSMGTLVMRAMLNDPANADLLAATRGLIYVFPPTVGAPVAYRRMFTGMTSEYDGGLAGFPEQHILGDTREAFVGNMSSVPGPMQLHPSDYYPPVEGGYWHPDRAAKNTKQIYEDPNSPPGLYDGTLDLPQDALNSLKDRIRDIVEFHAFLGAPTALPKPELSYLLYGDKVETDVAVEYYRGDIRPVKRPEDDDDPPDDISGDGTVPAVSALALGFPVDHVERFDYVEHGDACIDEAVCEKAAKLAAAF